MKNKDKYDLRDILYAIERDYYKYEFVVYYNFIEIHRESFCNCDSICGAFTKWLEEEYVPDILTDKEKAYLSAVIKPWKNKIKFIEKFNDTYDNERILIWIIGDCRNIYLPQFEKEKMYKGMELNKRYTLEDLGL